ncbi:MAG: hypothetical protein Q4G45_03695 [Actinomycetia bacterium]|nr:hypothetical protein [Actinomycetes bacterium]
MRPAGKAPAARRGRARGRRQRTATPGATKADSLVVARTVVGGRCRQPPRAAAQGSAHDLAGQSGRRLRAGGVARRTPVRDRAGRGAGAAGPSLSRQAADRGAGTAMVSLVAVGLSLVTWVLMMVGGYVLAVHRARSAADLAALAGAVAYAGGRDACAAADQSARTNHGQVTACRVEGSPASFVLTLTAQAPVGWTIPGAPRTVAAESRAGNA